MTEYNDELVLPESNFLELDETIFEIPESDETLAKVIDEFHRIAKKLDIFAVIEKETQGSAYYKYKFEDPSEPNFEISIYTPVPGIKTTLDNMNNENTLARY